MSFLRHLCSIKSIRAGAPFVFVTTDTPGFKNHWGNLLFETEEPETGWTGDFRASIMEPGVFVWQLRVK